MWASAPAGFHRAWDVAIRRLFIPGDNYYILLVAMHWCVEQQCGRCEPKPEVAQAPHRMSRLPPHTALELPMVPPNVLA